MKPVLCPYCGDDTEFITSEAFYGRDYGTNIYVCWPCDAYVGTHKGSKTALGTPADEALREARKKAHRAVDYFWKTRKESRSSTYRWIQAYLGLTPQEAHIGMFNLEQCKTITTASYERKVRLLQTKGCRK